MEESTIMKEKRTKQQRHHLLPHVISPILSPTTLLEISESPTEEEEEMANCLIFLAKGGYKPKLNEIEEATTAVNLTGRVTEPTTTATGKTENNVHKCRDCNMSFSSHKALGGHRASYNKKLKLSIPLASKVLNEFPFTSSVMIKVKSHKCYDCSSEFSSGQALGEHMRKHRQLITPEQTKKEDNSKAFYLDLNLPPPCDD
ncbi:zinc finger protein ZAT5-like [Phalaenopsis equestris]|uniref:zinc finger protein ZAT5-like n=1 Tax=Phalaenopsis equestris TaxID=78828 RepID=UPI0009E260BB|nr:zinc finger protein ZAT5-like [Phalaenopsis equestris]